MNRSVPRLSEKYRKEVIPQLMSQFGYKSIMQVPRLEKVVVNMGVGEATKDAKVLEAAKKDLQAICGQQPIVTRAKKSISSFKLRRGMPIGVMATLRGERMYHFLDKLFNIVLPRIRDFRGVSPNSWDGQGNYSLGLREQIVFPEVDYDKIYKVKGLQVNIITTAKTNEEGKWLLSLLGMPFER